MTYRTGTTRTNRLGIACVNTGQRRVWDAIPGRWYAPVMARRPLMKMRIDALEEHAAKGTAERAEVLAELEYRSTAAARRLAASLGTSVARRKVRPKSPAKESSPREKGATTKSVERTSDDQPPREKHVVPEFESLYENLRATFTIEGEILARWGMTPHLSREMEETVFEFWRTKMSDLPDEFDRTKDRLQRDVRALAAERALERDLMTGANDDRR